MILLEGCAEPLKSAEFSRIQGLRIQEIAFFAKIRECYIPLKYFQAESSTLKFIRKCQATYGNKIAAATTVVHNPFLSPSADCVIPQKRDLDNLAAHLIQFLTFIPSSACGIGVEL
jgi:hypothetical protein